MEYSPVTVAETESFQRKAGQLLSGKEKDELIAYLSAMVRKLVNFWSQKEMSKAFNEISSGLGDAIEHAKGKKGQVVVHKPDTINVKAIRAKTGMSQQRFCATFGISLGTLRHWEQGLRSPRGPARVLLKVVDNDPKAVIRAIDQ